MPIPDGELVSNPYPLGCVPSWLWLDRGSEPAQVCHLLRPTQSLLVVAVRWFGAQGVDQSMIRPQVCELGIGAEIAAPIPKPRYHTY
ncbi:hypothetical protein [Acaryochloris marina]|uniref:hypothetical protein n=1 Tax=Acaryochloris marina TaxID=155978 RepID=UPI0011D15519|nr:hypothetical protein [Acaryochloris marina]